MIFDLACLCSPDKPSRISLLIAHAHTHTHTHTRARTHTAFRTPRKKVLHSEMEQKSNFDRLLREPVQNHKKTLSNFGETPWLVCPYLLCLLHQTSKQNMNHKYNFLRNMCAPAMTVGTRKSSLRNSARSIPLSLADKAVLFDLCQRLAGLVNWPSSPLFAYPSRKAQVISQT